MGFIEKVVGLMNGSPTQEAASAPATPEEAVQVQTPGPQDAPADETAQEAAQQPKTYTPEDLETLFAEKKKEWQEERKAEEQERLRSLPEAERLKQEQLSKDAEIARLQTELTRRDLQAEIIAKLDERRLPAGIAELVQYGDKESTMQSLDKVMGVFETAVQEGVMLRLRGKTPEGLGGAASRENRLSDPFAKTFADAFKK